MGTLGASDLARETGREDASPVGIDDLAEGQLTAHFQVALVIC